MQEEEIRKIIKAKGVFNRLLKMVNQNAFKSEKIINNIQVPGMARKGNAGLPIHSKEKRAIVFVDANN